MKVSKQRLRNIIRKNLLEWSVNFGSSSGSGSPSTAVGEYSSGSPVMSWEETGPEGPCPPPPLKCEDDEDDEDADVLEEDDDLVEALLYKLRENAGQPPLATASVGPQEITASWSQSGLTLNLEVNGRPIIRLMSQRDARDLISLLEELLSGPMRTMG